MRRQRRRWGASFNPSSALLRGRADRANRQDEREAGARLQREARRDRRNWARVAGRLRPAVAAPNPPQGRVLLPRDGKAARRRQRLPRSGPLRVLRGTHRRRDPPARLDGRSRRPVRRRPHDHACAPALCVPRRHRNHRARRPGWPTHCRPARRARRRGHRGVLPGVLDVRAVTVVRDARAALGRDHDPRRLSLPRAAWTPSGDRDRRMLRCAGIAAHRTDPPTGLAPRPARALDPARLVTEAPGMARGVIHDLRRDRCSLDRVQRLALQQSGFSSPPTPV